MLPARRLRARIVERPDGALALDLRASGGSPGEDLGAAEPLVAKADLDPEVGQVDEARPGRAEQEQLLGLAIGSPDLPRVRALQRGEQLVVRRQHEPAPVVRARRSTQLDHAGGRRRRRGAHVEQPAGERGPDLDVPGMRRRGRGLDLRDQGRGRVAQARGQGEALVVEEAGAAPRDQEAPLVLDPTGLPRPALGVSQLLVHDLR